MAVECEGRPEIREVVEYAFFDMYGIPISWAHQMTQLEGEIAERAREMLAHFGKVFDGGKSMEKHNND